MGFFDETVSTFEVYNQPLFAYPDTADMSDAILYGILHDEDIATHMKRAMVTNLNMGHVRRFNRRLTDGSYPYGYPEVGTSFNYPITPELQAIIDNEYGNPMETSFVSIGSLTDSNWILSELGKNNIQSEFTYISKSAFHCPDENEIEFNYNGDGYISTISVAYFDGGVAKIRTEVDVGSSENENIIIFTFDTDIQPKPATNEEFITIWCSFCNETLNGEFHVWVYNTAENTYPEIGEIPTFHFGSTVGYTECFPAVPLRVKNVNYNDEDSVLDVDAIERQLKIFGVDAELLISEVMGNPSVDADKTDNIFSNFGVRIWDESEAGRQYLYTFFAELHSYVLQSEEDDYRVDCIETKESVEGDSEEFIESVTPEKECNSISVDTDFSETKFFFSGIKNEFFTKAQVDADPDLSSVYYSDQKFFDDNGNLKKTYHSSSGELLRPAGYTAMYEEDVESWINGNGVKSVREVQEGDTGWNWLKPAVRIINYSGIVYDPDEIVLVTDELIPENIYEIYEDGIKIVTPLVPEDVTSITYYAILADGMDSFTVYGAGGQVFVEDTETSASRLVKLTLRETNKLTVPIMFGLLENRYEDRELHDKVDALVASMHMSVYVADVTTVELPWWAIALKVISLVIAIVLIYFGMAGSWLLYAEGAIVEAVLAGVSMYIVSTVIFEIINEISPWLSIVASVVSVLYGYYNSGGIAALNIGTMSLTQALQVALKIITTAIKVVGLLEADSQEDSFRLLDDKFKEEMNEINKLVGVDRTSNVALDALYGRTEVSIAPIDPEAYFNKADNFCDIGISMLDVDSIYDNLDNPSIMLPGMA